MKRRTTRVAGGWHPSSKTERRTARLIESRQRIKRRLGSRCHYCGWRPKRRKDFRWLDVHERAASNALACKWCHGMLSNGKRPSLSYSRAARRRRRIP